MNWETHRVFLMSSVQPEDVVTSAVLCLVSRWDVTDTSFGNGLSSYSR